MSYWSINDDCYPYSIGTLVRYDSGPTALMRIVSLHVGAHGYHGEHCMGGLHFAGHNSCKRASAEDHKVFDEVAEKYHLRQFRRER